MSQSSSVLPTPSKQSSFCISFCHHLVCTTGIPPLLGINDIPSNTSSCKLSAFSASTWRLTQALTSTSSIYLRNRSYHPIQHTSPTLSNNEYIVLQYRYPSRPSFLYRSSASRHLFYARMHKCPQSQEKALMPHRFGSS